MPEKNKFYSYNYYSEPVKDKYTFGDDRKALIEFSINDCMLKLYQDENKHIEMLRIDIVNPDRDSNFIAHYLKNYVQSVLRLSYAMDFKFSRIISKMIGEFTDEKDKPKVNTGTFDLTKEKKEPIFNAQMFSQMLNLFSKKAPQIDLFTSDLDFINDPIGCYFNLYKIIEFEFHLSEDRRKTKEILKASPLKQITNKFTFDNKTGNDLIEYIIDTRHKCDHLKDSKFGTIFGFSQSNINDVKEVQKFIPTMRKICAKVIDKGFEILD